MALDNENSVPTLFSEIEVAAKRIRSEAVNGYGQVWEAYTILGDLLSSLVKQVTDDPIAISESASQRIALTANLLQSSSIVTDAISSGFYWAASTILRAQMEALARVIHIREGNFSIDKKPPNVSILPFDLSSKYGRLSELAHVSNGEFLADLAVAPNSGHVAATYVPIYRQDWAQGLLAHHVIQLFVLAQEIDQLRQELYPGITPMDLDVPFQRVATILGGN